MANLADKAVAQVKSLRDDFTDRVRVITKYCDLDMEADLGGGLEILFFEFRQQRSSRRGRSVCP
jgi:hypothetical protein